MRHIPFPRPIQRESLIDVIERLHKLVIKTGITPDQLVKCSELVRENVKKIEEMRR